MTVIKPYLKLIRPKQWAKNVFIFIPLVFDGQLRLKSSFLKTLAGFALLCALYAATYIFNDLNDLEADRAHPKKKNRPLANGDVPAANAVILALALTAISLWLGYRLSPGFFHAELAIIAINIVYKIGRAHV